MKVTKVIEEECKNLNDEEIDKLRDDHTYTNITTYSITFCRMDSDGNMLKDDKGEVIEYRANDLCDDLSDDLELDDLEEV
jgi:hypothetical protein